ncbi:hypothetical protein KOM00_07300 [Geomonas sp. Red69]|uniref:hypothetical protein n=1 Tax=Geomonas diazotrophica TaxID=2843197 RepID=UPI001C1003F4|nr:hypothetical protein [Geomonas diazotrophica]MBU5636541.1 hypothetical protein [Geomonas diazotrophica]
MADGVLIFKGMKVGFLPGDFSISVNDNGEKSKSASESISEKWNENSELQKELLMAELAPSMQVFVSCGIGLDALYDTLRPYAKISSQEIEAWRKNKTSRAKQIVEMLRRTHKLKPDVLNDFSKCISQVIKYRDMAVHPSQELKNACTRPDIQVGVDWKFSAYRFSNAEWCLTNTINMIVYLYEHKSGSNEVDESISNIVDALEELKVVQRSA